VIGAPRIATNCQLMAPFVCPLPYSSCTASEPDKNARCYTASIEDHRFSAYAIT
jgi:hypothetical protein